MVAIGCKNTQKEFQVYVQEKRLNLKSGIGNIRSVFIYDLKGALLYQKKNIDKELFVVPDLIPMYQFLIIKAVFDNGGNRTTKVVF